jgi:hypothetical protein
MDTRDILIDAFGRVRGVVHAVVDGLDPAHLTYRPDADANSIAWLLWHLTRIEDSHVADLAGRDQDYVAGGWPDRFGLPADDWDTGYGHTSERVAAVAPPSADDLVAYYDVVHERTLAYLATVDAAELGRIVDTNWDPPVSAGVRIVSVIDDCLQHAGQAAYVRGIAERTG